MRRVELYLRAFIVGGRCSHSPLPVTIDRQSGNVDHATSDALIRLTFTSHAQRQPIAHELICIEAANAVTKCDAGKVDEVD